MGQLELFAQRTFADETERMTGGAAEWQDPPEIRLEKSTSDGFLVRLSPRPCRARIALTTSTPSSMAWPSSAMKPTAADTGRVMPTTLRPSRATGMLTRVIFAPHPDRYVNARIARIPQLESWDG